MDVMTKINPEDLENFIRDNRDKFNIYRPHKTHSQSFLGKLQKRFKHFISIVPYLIKVFIATTLIFVSSIIIWNNYIRKDRHEITLKQKIYVFFDVTKRGSN
jgi:hypothetical protein